MKKWIIFLTFLLLTAVSLAQEFAIAANTYSQTYPEAAFANEQYFTVFLDKRTSSYQYEFWAKFVSQEGVIDPNEHQIVPPHNAMSFMHHIMYGSSNYLFAWSRQRSATNYTRDAYGRIVGQDGNPVGAQFAISSGNTESCSFLKVAFDGTNYLTVWQEGMPNQGAKIKGQFVDPNGQMVGSNFEIRPVSLAPTVSQIYPDIVFNGTNYLVAWDDDRNGNRDIFAQFVGTDGSLIGDDIAVCTLTSKQLLVQMAYNGSNYLLVWADERNSTNDDSVYGQLVGNDGSLIGDNIAITVPSNSEGRSWPAVASSAGQFLVTWKQDFLVYDDEIREISTDQEVMNLSAGINPSDPTVWYDVWGRKVEFDGSTPEPEFAICTVENHQDESCIASDGTDFLVAWEDSRNANQYYDIYGLIVEGTAVDPGFVEGTVILNGGTGNVENVLIAAGTNITNPDASGFYQIELLPGNYLLSAELEGYEYFETSIDITSGNVTNQDITLEPFTYEPPINMTIEVVNFNDVLITWELPTGTATLTGYRIYRDGVLIADITDPNTLEYLDPALNAGVYEFYLTAVYGTIESIPVAANAIITLPPPTNLTGASSFPNILLTWTPPQFTRDLSSYNVYRDDEIIATNIPQPLYIDESPPYNWYVYNVTAVYSGDWESEFSDDLLIEGGVGTDDELIPSTKLIGNYPNPFNPRTTISFSLTSKDAQDAKLEIYNLKGEKIKSYSPSSCHPELVEGRGKSTYNVVWNGTDENGKPVSSGIYFYKLKSRNYSETRKMTLMK